MEIHLILMDIMMPELDGITATARLREKYNIPVILLTAKSEDTDKILGLKIGADDYITKPFNPVELIARVKAQIRRYTYLGGNRKTDHVLCIGGVALDDRAKSVSLDGEPVALTPTANSCGACSTTCSTTSVRLRSGLQGYPDWMTRPIERTGKDCNQ